MLASPLTRTRMSSCARTLVARVALIAIVAACSAACPSREPQPPQVTRTDAAPMLDEAERPSPAGYSPAQRRH